MDENLFEEMVTPDQTNEVVEEVATEETKQEEVVESTPAETKPTKFKFKTKVNHEETENEYEENEIVEALQKKANYDKIVQKNSELDNDVKWLLKRAKQSGYNDLSTYKQAVEQAEIQQAIDQVMAENEGISAEAAAKIVKADMKEKEEISKTSDNAKTKEFDKFLNKFPNVDVKSIPSSVFENTEKNGLTLIESYLEYQLEQAKQTVSIKQKENENKERAIIKGTTGTATEEVGRKDAFLEGFGD